VRNKRARGFLPHPVPKQVEVSNPADRQTHRREVCRVGLCQKGPQPPVEQDTACFVEADARSLRVLALAEEGFRRRVQRFRERLDWQRLYDFRVAVQKEHAKF